METISTSQALQIAGRAGRSVFGPSPWFPFRVAQRCSCGLALSSVCRFSSKFKEGEVTTLHRNDLPVLKEILSHSVDPIEVNVHTHTHINAFSILALQVMTCLFRLARF